MLVPLTLVAACASPAPPQSPSDARPAAAGREEVVLESRVRRAALFKNGLAFVQREASVEPATVLGRLDGLPAPLHGTFWLAADPERLAIGRGVARRDVRLERSPATTIPDLLRANVGRELRLLLVGDVELAGRLVAFPEPDPDPEPGSVVWPPGSIPIQPPPGALMLVETAEGLVGLAPSEVRRVTAGELTREVERRREAVSLTVELTAVPGGAAPLSVEYLVRGLTWVPSYAIDVSDGATATLTAKAMVINEAEVLQGATLELVTGYPNLQFAHVVDPVAMHGSLDGFLAALGRSPAESGAAVMRQSLMSNVAFFDEAPVFPVAGAPADGAAVEDLFFYAVEGVTLERGERGLYQLFSVRVPCEHLYEWEIPDTTDSGSARHGEVEDEAEEIWHSVRLRNESTLPWTTAPAMTMKDGRLLGQDTLRYTSVGAPATVRITRAVDVQGEKAELETARERGAESFYGSRYDRVTVRGELRVTNRKTEPVVLEVQKSLQGEMTANPDEATVVTVAEGLRRVNPSTRLTWQVPLAPGATRQLTYEYTLFVRS